MTGDVLKVVEDEQLQDNKPDAVKKHWKMSRDADDILWLDFDKKGAGTNTLGSEVLKELDTILSEIEGNLPHGVVIRSAKKGGFCAGADIGEFRDFTQGDIIALLERGHGVLDRLEGLAVPTVAVVHGHCLGGGLELALACDMRIGVKGGLQMGFPEIKLGVHPGLGGTFRLTSLIDPTVAMTMMLTGKSAYDGQTKKRGLVDALVEDRHVAAAAKAAINGEIGRHDQDFKDHALNSMGVRSLIARKMRAKTAEKAPQKHYPAPYALIDLWEEHGGDNKAMQKAEIQSFAGMLSTETAQNLVRVFFLQQGLKDLAKKGEKVEHVHVIGAGAMGGDIAGWCAMQGLRVTLSDMKAEPIAAAIKETAKLCKDKHKSSIETRDTLDRLIPDLKNSGAARADLVIEAVPEDLKIKQKVYQSVEPLMKKGAILATNTSSIPLDKLAKGLKRPTYFAGLHFFNPVSKMMVVEVVRHAGTGKKMYQKALSFAGQIGKLPTPVDSYPGFLVNRALTPYLLEAVLLMDEGVDKRVIDRTAEDFGMPMGPVEVADQVGLDICLHVAEMLNKSLKKPIADMPDWLGKMVDDGRLGKKTGEGFYKWEKGRAQKDDDGVKPDPDIADRLILPMLNACVECYREGVIDDLDHLDGAMIFATGFAPFTGGPMNYAKNRGVDDIVKKLDALAEKHGDRFKPDKGWKKL